MNSDDIYDSNTNMKEQYSKLKSKKKYRTDKHQKKTNLKNDVGKNVCNSPPSKFGSKLFLKPETLLSNNTSNYGTVIERFLPVMKTSPGTKLYHPSLKNLSINEINLETDSNLYGGVDNNTIRASNIANSNNNTNNPIIISNHELQINSWFREPIQEEITNNNTASIHDITNVESVGSSTNNLTPVSEFFKSQIPQISTHKENVANALGFKTQRIFNFKPLKSPKKSKALYEEESLILINSNDDHDVNIDDKRNNSYLTEVPFKILDAPGLRNDYYSNLVCWANLSDTIAAGLGSVVYCWSESLGTIPLQSFGNELISALSYSNNDYLAVGTKESRILLYEPNSVYIVATFLLKNHSSICSIKWVPHSDHFFVGNDIGEITLFEVIKVESKIANFKKLQRKEPFFDSSKFKKKIKYNLKHKITFKCDQQQICGIDVNSLGKQLAVGVNNNSSSIWDISDLTNPKKMFHLKHEAAVKAVAFCPWMPNLLATGGGSRDKNIRFWHSKSGTLISKHKTKGQITAVIWSRSKKEILVTFGFGESSEKNCILAVYSYPSMKLKIRVNAPPDMRILTADLSNDFHSICASISDQSVRIYNIWNSKYDLKSKVYDNDAYGSEIINTEEGVNEEIDIIR